eukprot:3642727-Prymnesium_polylepis.1
MCSALPPVASRARTHGDAPHARSIRNVAVAPLRALLCSGLWPFESKASSSIAALKRHGSRIMLAMSSRDWSMAACRIASSSVGAGYD